MMMHTLYKPVFKTLLIGLMLSLGSSLWASNDGVRIKDISRLKGLRDNSLIGYGIVVGLAGTGDSPRSQATVMSIASALQRFGVKVSAADIRSRNVAAVTLTATLPPFANQGDTLDVEVTSIGDARSLVGGTLLLADLKAVDQQIYALAQGPLTVGGYQFANNTTLVQKNHPTAAVIPSGALVERELRSALQEHSGDAELVLYHADITTSVRIAEAINAHMQQSLAVAISPANVRLATAAMSPEQVVVLLRDIENLRVSPDSKARVVINERTGTIVSGGAVRISAADITHGDIKISIAQDTQVYQPRPIVLAGDAQIETLVVQDTQISVDESAQTPVSVRDGSTVSDLVLALNQSHVSSREVISILQTLRKAGALHAELVVQ